MNKITLVKAFVTYAGYFGYISQVTPQTGDPWLCGYLNVNKEFSEEECYTLRVHGGITYNEPSPTIKTIQGKADHWLGFDCIHGGDNIKVQNTYYVERELELLAYQIRDIEKER